MRAIFVSKDFSQISVKEFESIEEFSENVTCLLYTSDAADE